MDPRTFYASPLARIHHQGFAAVAESAAAALEGLLAGRNIAKGLIIDLGCGSGLLGRRLSPRGYEFLGIDASESMIDIARREVPRGRFLVSTIADAPLEPAVAIAATGEVLNYVDRPDAPAPDLASVFRRIRHALRPGGVFLFDICTPARIPPEGSYRVFTEAPGWAVLSHVALTPGGRTLERRIVSFLREDTGLYRRFEETHWQFLFTPSEVEEALLASGFHHSTTTSYGTQPLPAGCLGYICE